MSLNHLLNALPYLDINVDGISSVSGNFSGTITVNEVDAQAIKINGCSIYPGNGNGTPLPPGLGNWASYPGTYPFVLSNASAFSFQNTDPNGLYVSANSSDNCQFTTITDAINSISNFSSPVTIYVKSGTYNETLTLPTNVVLIGYTSQTVFPTAILNGNIVFTPTNGFRYIQGFHVEGTIRGNVSNNLHCYIDNCLLDSTLPIDININDPTSLICQNTTIKQGNVWLFGGVHIFDNCSFGVISGDAVFVYSQGNANVQFLNCDMYLSGDDPNCGIGIAANANVTFEGCQVDYGDQPFSLVYSSGILNIYNSVFTSAGTSDHNFIDPDSYGTVNIALAVLNKRSIIPPSVYNLGLVSDVSTNNIISNNLVSNNLVSNTTNSNYINCSNIVSNDTIMCSNLISNTFSNLTNISTLSVTFDNINYLEAYAYSNYVPVISDAHGNSPTTNIKIGYYQVIGGVCDAFISISWTALGNINTADPVFITLPLPSAALANIGSPGTILAKGTLTTYTALYSLIFGGVTQTSVFYQSATGYSAVTWTHLGTANTLYLKVSYMI